MPLTHPLFLFGALALMPLARAADSPAPPPGNYQKGASWQETLRVAREAQAVQLAGVRSHNDAAASAQDPALARFEPWLRTAVRADVPGANRPAVTDKVKLRITGLKGISLGSQLLGAPGGKGLVEWLDLSLVDQAGHKTLLTTLAPKGWLGSRGSLKPENRQLKLSGGEVTFALEGGYEWLEGRVRLEIGDGIEAWISGRSWFAEKQTAAQSRSRLLTQLDADFPTPDDQHQRALEGRAGIWLQDWTPGDLAGLAGRYAKACTTKLRDQATPLALHTTSTADLAAVRHLFLTDAACREMLVRLASVNPAALHLAIADLTATFPTTYPNGPEFTRQAAELPNQLNGIREKLAVGDAAALPLAAAVLGFEQAALLANPLLGFEKLVLVRRKGADNLGLSTNFGPSINPGLDAEIAVLSPVAPGGKVSTLFRDPAGKGVCDVDLDFDADKMLFTMSDLKDNPIDPGTYQSFGLQLTKSDQKGNSQIWEVRADGGGLRQVSPGEEAAEPGKSRCAVQNCDASYLPDGKIVFVSTATMTGVPCVGGSLPVGNLYRMDAAGQNIMQLTFDQDQNWHPTVLDSGQVMYLRWEYTDTPHYFTRLLFTMNPDGTGQTALSGSNSYWPNSFFGARPIPHQPTQVVGVVSGHHGTQRAGELVILDTAKGRSEADGALQRIPGHGKKVDAVIKDGLVEDSWPKFLHPYPLGGADGRGAGKYFLVSCKLTADAPWGIYLVDVFDNLTPILVEPGYSLMEPLPLVKRPRPAVAPDRIDPQRKDALVYLQDIYQGPGLAGIPRGTVKQLRLITYHYNYRGMGSHSLVGQESGWDVKSILGTVPVAADGSAMFYIPANTPIALQPLDQDGRALQLMRSWLTARPGETLSCVGCHEDASTTPVGQRSLGGSRSPDAIKPFHGPARGFSYEREVQPLLNQYCISCHNGSQREDGRTLPDFANRALKKESHSAGVFSQSYLALNPHVRRPGPESDYHLPLPMEWHADTSPLVQLLKKGHHQVTLDPVAWDKLYAWIDLNVPYFGSYRETNAWNRNSEQASVRRRELLKRYAGVDVDPEAVPAAVPPPSSPPAPPPAENPKAPGAAPELAGWPLAAAAAQQLQAGAAGSVRKSLALADGAALNLVLVPAGEFIMGDAAGAPDERPRAAVTIQKPFWMGEVEISNRLFARFDPQHDSRYQDKPGKDLTTRGVPANEPDQPVVRVSWQQATEFCAWLSTQTGMTFGLPTEAQWEWACRAGAETAPPSLLGRHEVKWGAAAKVGASAANPWGLKDMYGNVSEWTGSVYRPYPYRDADGRNDPAAAAACRVVRGGSWEDGLSRVRAGIRIPYQPFRALHNVGFRVVCEAEPVRHRFLKSGWMSGGPAIYAADFKPEWSLANAAESSDGWVLPDRGVVFSYSIRGKEAGIIRLDPAGKPLWKYLAPDNHDNHSCQPLPGGGFLAGETAPNGMWMVEIDRDGKEQQRVKVGDATRDLHHTFRQVRKTPQGTYLATVMNENKTCEWDATGKLLRTFPRGVFVAIRLPNGNTLVSTGNPSAAYGAVIEYDPQAKVVWEVTLADLKALGIQVSMVCGLQRLPNGNTVITNVNHGQPVGSGDMVKAFEITPAKQMVWSIPGSLSNGNMGNIQILDVPGDVFKFGVLK